MAVVCVLLVLPALGLALSPTAAVAARVLVMGPGGRVHTVNNRFLNGVASDLPAPGSDPLTANPAADSLASADPVAGARQMVTFGARATAAATKSSSKGKTSQVTVVSVLYKLEKAGAITAAEHATYLGDWITALREEQKLSGWRKTNLTDVTVLLHDMAIRNLMTVSRLPVLFLTLGRNAQWWKTGAALGYGERVQFAGSPLDWEYYPGEGIQLTVLGTFGEADGFYEAGPSEYGELETLMSQMIPLAVQRGGNLAWEYYFNWEGGTPPWVSAMAQATGIEALTNAYKATRDASYLTVAAQALPLLETAPPTGVGVKTYLGMQYLQYSFTRTDIINAFLQTLIGLDDFAKVSGNTTAEQLFSEGTVQAQAVLPSFNTGAWSLYQPGQEDDLSYHELVTGFLQTLCTQTKTPIYCTTATDFKNDLTTAPVLTQVTTTAKRKKPFDLYFKLSKISKVGIIVSSSSGKQYLYTSAQVPYGTHYYVVPALKAGSYDVRLSATDLAGNYSSITGTVTVS